MSQIQYTNVSNVHELLFDFVFVGMGASNSLIFKKLLESDLLKNKKVAIIEAELKNENDKTYCFWSSNNDNIVKDLSPIISHHYSHIEINKTNKQNISAQPYFYIRSIDLYEYTKQLIKYNEIPVFQATCNDITSTNGYNVVQTNIAFFNAKIVFDSRPPKIDSSKNIYLHQSFFGLHVKFQKEVFDSNTFEMMNFDIEQNNSTQFFYVLPFSNTEALIELTRFGSEKINIDYAKKVLSNKIESLYGDYQVISEEIGCIPMTTFINPASNHEGLINTGSRANLIKPSTGYGFKNMFLFAEEVKNSIDKAGFKQLPFQSKNRFKFYDALLLIILLRWPKLGKVIFSQLFKSQKIATIFSFLDEKTTLRQEMSIFSSLPFKPFIKAAFIHFFKYINFKTIAIFIALLLYFSLSYYGSIYAETYINALIVLGLLLIGIPHGAVDHLLQKDTRPLYYFIAKYLSIMVLNFAVWIYAPKIAFILFILYSCFHFGESETVKIRPTSSKLMLSLRGMLIGALVLFIIIFSHWHESLTVLKHIDHLWPQNQAAIQLSDFSYSVVITIAFLGLYLCLFQNKRHFWHLATILLLGLILPLMAAFSLYFICQHSVNAWQDLKKGLTLNSLQLYKQALPYLLGAIGVFFCILMFNPIMDYSRMTVISSFFIFLSCISLPHVILMHVFYRQSNYNSI